MCSDIVPFPKKDPASRRLKTEVSKAEVVMLPTVPNLAAHFKKAVDLFDVPIILEMDAKSVLEAIAAYSSSVVFHAPPLSTGRKQILKQIAYTAIYDYVNMMPQTIKEAMEDPSEGASQFVIYHKTFDRIARSAADLYRAEVRERVMKEEQKQRALQKSRL